MKATSRSTRDMLLVAAAWLIPTVAASANTVSGEVRLAASPNDPLPNARITIFTPSLSFFAEARTDASGAFSIGGIPDGPYEVGCAAMRHDYVQDTVAIGPSGLQYDFELDPESHIGQWDIIGTTAPEFLDATDIAVLLPDGNLYFCHDTTDPILFDP